MKNRLAWNPKGFFKRLPAYLRCLAIIFVSCLALLPFYILFIIATSSPARDLSQGLPIPGLYLQNFSAAWEASAMGLSIYNSLVITIGAVVLLIVASSSAGYAIARFPNRLHRLVYHAFLFSMMIPAIINTVPLYTLMRAIGGINTHWAMILVCATNALPFAVFLYTGFIKSVSGEIEEAAVIDGCTKFSAFFRVTFHLVKPVTATVVIISGLGIWNNYAQAVFFLQSQEMRTIPLAVSLFFQQYGAKWNLMAAAAFIGMAPAVITFLLFQKYFIKGLSSGAVKG